jgi:hypothetical protein
MCDPILLGVLLIILSNNFKNYYLILLDYAKERNFYLVEKGSFFIS